MHFNLARYKWKKTSWYIWEKFYFFFFIRHYWIFKKSSYSPEDRKSKSCIKYWPLHKNSFTYQRHTGELVNRWLNFNLASISERKLRIIAKKRFTLFFIRHYWNLKKSFYNSEDRKSKSCIRYWPLHKKIIYLPKTGSYK